MDNYSSNDRPYIYCMFPHRASEIVNRVLESLHNDGVECYSSNFFDRKEKSRIKRSFGVLIFLDNELSKKDYFISLVDYATLCGKNILCVYLDTVDLTPWISMQLGSQRALFYDGNVEKLTASLKEGHIFRDMEVTEEQKESQKRRAFSAFAVPIIAAAVLFLTVINPLLVEPLQQKTNFKRQYGITTEDLSKIEELHIVGNESFDTYVHANYDSNDKKTVVYDKDIDGVMTHQDAISAGTMTSEDLEILKYMPNLKILEIEAQQITDISPIFDTNVEHLRLNCNPITSIEGIEKMTSLHTLIMSDTDVTDISPAFNLEHLSMLQFDNTYVSDLSGIENLKDLKTLMLSNTKVKEIPELGEIENFYLDVRENKIYDMSWIKNIKSFGCVLINSMGDCMRPEDVMQYLEGKPISSIGWCGIESLEDIYGLNIVKGGELCLANNYLTTLEGIENFEGIASLGLFHNKGYPITFADLSPVLELKSLEILSLSPDMEQMAKEQLSGATFEIEYKWG